MDHLYQVILDLYAKVLYISSKEIISDGSRDGTILNNIIVERQYSTRQYWCH